MTNAAVGVSIQQTLAVSHHYMLSKVSNPRKLLQPIDTNAFLKSFFIDVFDINANQACLIAQRTIESQQNTTACII